MAKKNDDKIGSGHAKAMARQGLAELRAAFYPNSNIAQPTEYGVFGRETPGEIADGREDVRAANEEGRGDGKLGSVLKEAMAEAKGRATGRDERSAGREAGEVSVGERE